MVEAAFAHVGITCKDLVVTEKFYAKYFGFSRARVVPLGEDEQIVFIKSGNVYLELFKAKENSPIDSPSADGYGFPGLRHLAFAVNDVEAKVKEMGEDTKVSLGPLKFDDFIKGWSAAWVTDPDGNIIELSQGYQDE